MHWTLVVVHILILTVISFNSFPIDLNEIELDDVHLIDKERKGRFIQVNQTTFLPHTKPIELVREKKSSMKEEVRKRLQENLNFKISILNFCITPEIIRSACYKSEQCCN